MSAQSVTITLPAPYYHQLEKRAAQKRHTLEQELLDVVAQSTPTAIMPPTELDEVVESLELLNDDELWQAARALVGRSFSHL
jgi:predicted NAD/FAD-dependent oxidoreductase